MSPTPEQIELRIEEYWDWIAWSLFLLLTVDLLTTFYAVRVAGLNAEANPVVRWLLAEGSLTITLANLGAAVLVVVMFHGLMEMLRIAPGEFRGPFARIIEIWLGLLLAIGLWVFANNLMVIVTGHSLL